MNIFQKFACHRSGAFTSGKKLWKNLWENYEQDRVSSSLPRSRFLDVTQRSPKRGKRGVGGGGVGGHPKNCCAGEGGGGGGGGGGVA